MASSVSHVFQFTQFNDQNDSHSPPALTKTNDTSMGDVVDVINEFYWTYSPKGQNAREEVPMLRLVEKELKTNALVAQILYSAGVAKDGFVNQARGLLGKNADDLFKAVSNLTGKGVEKLEEMSPETAFATKNKIDALTSKIKDENPVFADGKNSWLQPYKNLYLTKDTGWIFHFPYFENFAAAAQNAFSGDPGPGGFLGLAGALSNITTNLAESFAVMDSPLQVSYVERSKYFNYPTEGEEFTFTFPLINTGGATYEDVIRNWQLIYLLLYNNRPARKNTSVIEQPRVYEVTLPGVKYMPFAYFQGIQVEFQGARRQMKIPLPPGIRNYNSDATYEAIIPDAYLIKITLKGLIAESKNFMYHMLNPSGPVQVLNRDDAMSIDFSKFSGVIDPNGLPGGNVQVFGTKQGPTGLVDQFLGGTPQGQGVFFQQPGSPVEQFNIPPTPR